MTHVALDALEDFLDIVMRALEHLDKAFPIEHERTGNMACRIPLPGNGQYLFNFLMDIFITTGDGVTA
jgi:hypothetical protein